MLKQLLQTSLVVTGVLALTACDIDNMSEPVYSTGSQVRSNNQIVGSSAVYSTGSQVAPVTGSVGRSLPGAGRNEYNASNVVSGSVQPAPVAQQPVQSAAVSQQPVMAVTTHRVINANNGNVPAPIPVLSSSQDEPIVRSTPSRE